MRRIPAVPGAVRECRAAGTGVVTMACNSEEMAISEIVGLVLFSEVSVLYAIMIVALVFVI